MDTMISNASTEKALTVAVRDHEKFIAWKYFLTRVGAFLSPGIIYNLAGCLNYLEVGRWMRASGMKIVQRVKEREQLFDLVGAEVSERDVLYLEFGVFHGEATRYWSKLLRNPKSKLHGFDSFEGLPEDWAGVGPKSDWDVGGKIPKIDDPRVRFFQGWFDQTLPTYRFPEHEVMVVILDADLYSSTTTVLNALEDQIAPGTYLYFDEFNHRFDEMRAFDEFVKRTGMKFSVVGATTSLAGVAFRRVQ
jgi:hypothetical protein